jgi:DNA-binding transcriptional LysR family regulator
MDKLRAMEAFVAIMDAGTLTKAGQRLGRSLPAMVRTLAQLEEEVGVVLVRRTTRRMSITEEGRVYLARARKILADVAEAEAAIGTHQGELRGPVSVTAPSRFGELHVASPLAEFAESHRGIQVNLVLLDRVVNLVEEGIDLAVRIGARTNSSLIATTIGTMRQVVVSSPSLAAKQRAPSHPDELADRECVVFGSLGGPVWRFVVDGEPTSVSVQGRLRTNHVGAALKACQQGLGYGRFLAYQVEASLQSGELKTVLESFEPPALPVSLVFAEARLLSPRLRGLIDFLKPRLAEVLK